MLGIRLRYIYPHRIDEFYVLIPDSENPAGWIDVCAGQENWRPSRQPCGAIGLPKLRETHRVLWAGVPAALPAANREPA